MRVQLPQGGGPRPREENRGGRASPGRNLGEKKRPRNKRGREGRPELSMGSDGVVGPRRKVKEERGLNNNGYTYPGQKGGGHRANASGKGTGLIRRESIVSENAKKGRSSGTQKDDKRDVIFSGGPAVLPC